MSTRRKVLLGVFYFTVLAVVLIAVHNYGSPAPKARRIPYSVVPGKGSGRIVLVDPQYRNDADMRALGATLVDDYRNDRMAYVLVYDDLSAVQSRTTAIDMMLDSDTSSSLVMHHQQHFIGGYEKNTNTGHHSYWYGLDGADGKIVSVDY